jgi:hypothetical protein
MAGIVGLGRQLASSQIALALAGLALVAVIAGVDGAQILRSATGHDSKSGIEDLARTSDNLATWALPITIAVAPLACIGGALAMQFGGSKRAVPVMYASVGAVIAVLLAKGLAA